MAKKNDQDSSNELLRKYLGFATQLLVTLGVAVFAGVKLDKKFPRRIPLFVWILPLIVIFATIVKVIKDVTRKK